MGPSGEAPAGELDEGRHEVEPVWLDPARRPGDEALEQVPARAADVEEGPVPVDRIRDRTPGCLPARLVAAEAGLRARVLPGEIRSLEDRSHLGEPPRVVDLAAGARLIERVRLPLPARPVRDASRARRPWSCSSVRPASSPRRS